MPKLGKIALLTLVCGLTSLASAQDVTGVIGSTSALKHGSRQDRGQTGQTLSSDERLSVIAAALELKGPRRAGRDCSHLVHTIYESAGFPYTYASSYDLYSGADGFQRVSRPQSGDLVVWRGHAGIVIRPSRHTFFSFLHAGPATDDYTSHYWRKRGEPRFFRYIKHDLCPGCRVVGSTRRD